ncbi:radical SAM protein [Rhizobium laguerreae]|uniref:radical SAM/SPASM domain-containing protein n=1 Tax=Rhizobium laguerreae TaxID=1076926 RepID=UPI001C913779|nr:radical SAM protein [Rhizobium laguerreae]MBY3150873.1 radical SAM protein [Rhizobium laguerreae]
MNGRDIYVMDAGVHYVPRDGQHLFVNPELPDWLLLNTNGALILSLLDGEHSLQDVITIATGQGVPESHVKATVTRALYHGIVARDGYVVPSVAPENPRELRTILIKVTNNCNLSCDYCYAESGVGESLTNDDLTKILADVNARFGPVRFELSGGEPLLHKGTVPFAVAARASGHTTALLTNGAVINHRNVDDIAMAFEMVQISIDGADAEGHDCHRGEGSHAKATAAAELLMERGVNVQIGMTMSFGSMKSIDRMIAKWGKRLKIKPMSVIGRGAQRIGALTADEHFKFIEPYYNSVEAGHPRLKVAQFVSNQRRARAKKCAIGDMHVSISETGDVYPCHLVHDKCYLAGNIRQQSLGDIYDRSPVLIDLERFSVDIMTPCKTCTVKRLCAGGCPAVALAESDRIDVAPSFCAHERRRFIDAIFDVEGGILAKSEDVPEPSVIA